MKYLVYVLLAISLIGCSKNTDVVRLASGTEFKNDSLGTGREAKVGDLISFHFTGWIITDSSNVYNDWSKDSSRFMSLFGSSVNFGQPIKIKLGDSSFVRGIDDAIVGMKSGGFRTIIIPAKNAYGEMGYGPIPPNSSLKIVVNLLDVRDPIIAKPWNIDTSKIVTSSSGLKYCIVEPGSLERVDSLDLITVHYSGFLTSGKVFDSSVERDEPYKFRYKLQGVIPGWDEGIKLVGKGGKIKLIVPPSLGYGDVPVGSIPPNSTLVFDVELIDLEKM